MNIIIPRTFNLNLCEDSQTLRLQFFFVSKNKDDTYKQITPYIRCRDFLNDTLYCIENKKNFSLYGYKFNGKEFKRNLNSLYLCIKFEDYDETNITQFDESNNFNTNFHYLTAFETLYNLNTKTYYEETNLKNVILIKHNPFWFQNTVIFSLFTYILRCCCYKITGNFWDFIQKSTFFYKNWDDTLKRTSTTDAYLLLNIDKYKLKFFISNLDILDINSELTTLNLYFCDEIHEKLGFIYYINYLLNPKITIIKDKQICQDVADLVIPS